MSDTGSEPRKCPCGFWGSPQTQNLCSKCYKDELRRSEKLEDTKAALASTASSLGSESRTKAVTTSETTSNSEGNIETDKEEKGSAELSTQESKSQAEDRPAQKNKKRCWTCNSKLELAQRQLGVCRCEYVFCPLHRLPELHSCIFDHKESGRREARQKMVSPGPRKVGRSFQRMDE